MSDEIISTTPFSIVYDNFLSRITDDMYMELEEFDTYKMLEELLFSAIHKFEFPRKNLNDYEIYERKEDEENEGEYIYSGGQFNCELTQEEVNILGTYMIVEWLGQQLASIEVTRMKYSGPDFKMTSQANHMGKLQALKAEYEREGFHLQRLYKRRRVDDNGIMKSTFGDIMNGEV